MRDLRDTSAMSALELKVPPPVVALIVAAGMWIMSSFTPVIELSRPVRVLVALGIAGLAGCIDLAGFMAFRRARTSVNPMKPDRASSLVTAGIYGITRNPMYLGLLLLLVAWAVFLAAPWALLGPPAFAAYMTRFQIKPEERVLASRFGETYERYRGKVRRWL